MRQFTKKEIEAYLEYVEENVISLQEILGQCFICGESLDEVEFPEGPEKKVVCLKDRDYFIKAFDEYEYDGSESEFKPELLKVDDTGLIPGEIILLDWCNGKSTDKKFPSYFKSNYDVDVPASIDKLLDKNFLVYGNYYEQLKALTVAKLREVLKDHKNKSSGRKKEL